ncbi:hypothetical protein DPMN_049143 [Dreissena polymorpha]|uniref:Reverse transcriptase domain-containing protein n=1 Tax=Dreissena polymorpha TaxID=45954 RepID=A0A9D4DDN4_DREPO|nr:hypothetical protein DPMN_049143 [Dreissena polymorpha]
MSRLHSKHGGAQWNRSSTAESSLKNTCNTNVTFSTTSLSLRKRLTTCGMIAFIMLWEDFKMTKGWCKSFTKFTETPFTETPPVQFFLTDSKGTSHDITGVGQGCCLSPVMLNLFFELIMHETLHDHHNSISFGGRPIDRFPT